MENTSIVWYMLITRKPFEKIQSTFLNGYYFRGDNQKKGFAWEINAGRRCERRPVLIETGLIENQSQQPVVEGRFAKIPTKKSTNEDGESALYIN